MASNLSSFRLRQPSRYYVIPSNASGGSGTANQIVIGDISANDGNTYHLTFVDASGEQPLYINSNNGLFYKNLNLGVRTSTPSKAVDISGDIAISGALFANGVPGTMNQFLKSTGGGLVWAEVSGTASPNISITDGSGFGVYYPVIVQSAGTVPAYITSPNYVYRNQNLGLSTSTPLYTLDVSGDTRISQRFYANNSAGASNDLLTSTSTGIAWNNLQSVINNISNLRFANISVTNNANFRDISARNIDVSGQARFLDISARNIDASGYLSVVGRTTVRDISVNNTLQLFGGVYVNNSFGSPNQVLTSTGSGVTWANVGGGSANIDISDISGNGAYYPIIADGSGNRQLNITSSRFVYKNLNLGLNMINPEGTLDASGQCILRTPLVKIGIDAGFTNQGSNGIAIGSNAGLSNQRTNSIAIGTLAGACNQSSNCIAIGLNAGTSNQQSGSIAIGFNAGISNEFVNAIAIGTSAGAFDQSSNSIAIGNRAGFFRQDVSSIAIGDQAGTATQSFNCIAIGGLAGAFAQGKYGFAIGDQAGYCNQGSNTVALGVKAGYWSQFGGGIAVGFQSGVTNQGSNSIAIGASAGSFNQSSGAIAIGTNAGATRQGKESIAIGSNSIISDQSNNSIVINSTGGALTQTDNSATYILPLRQEPSGNVSLLFYNTSTKELTYSSNPSSVSNKTFVIPHPINNNKYLVHACLEGPEAGVFYRGKGEITNNSFTTITLPHYASMIATEFTVQITPVYDGLVKSYNISNVENNSFNVYGVNGMFHWIVHGKRNEIDIEPDKNNYILNSNGPYTWLSPK